MLNGWNCDRKSQLSGILTEPLNPRETKNHSTVYAANITQIILISSKMKKSLSEDLGQIAVWRSTPCIIEYKVKTKYRWSKNRGGGGVAGPVSCF